MIESTISVIFCFIHVHSSITMNKHFWHFIRNRYITQTTHTHTHSEWNERFMSVWTVCHCVRLYSIGAYQRGVLPSQSFKYSLIERYAILDLIRSTLCSTLSHSHRTIWHSYEERFLLFALIHIHTHTKCIRRIHMPLYHTGSYTTTPPFFSSLTH